MGLMCFSYCIRVDFAVLVLTIPHRLCSFYLVTRPHVDQGHLRTLGTKQWEILKSCIRSFLLPGLTMAYRTENEFFGINESTMAHAFPAASYYHSGGLMFLSAIFLYPCHYDRSGTSLRLHDNFISNPYLFY